MNAVASVFDFRGTVELRRVEPTGKNIPRTLHIVSKAIRHNPWGLTPAEVDVMDALVSCDGQKHAADKLGLALRTIEDHASSARRKMGTRGHYQHLLKWQAWRSSGSPNRSI